MVTATRPLAQELAALVAAGRFDEALALFRAQDATRVDPESMYQAATAAARTGSFHGAIALALRALEITKEAQDHDACGRTANLLGGIALEQGAIAEADHWFGEALAWARLVDNRGLAARATNNLATIADARGRTHLAISLYRNALTLYRQLRDLRGAAQTSHNLGLTLRRRRQLRASAMAADEAVQMAEQAEDLGLLSLALMGRAETAVVQEEYESAVADLERAEELARKANDQVGLAEAGRIRALLNLRQGRCEAAHAEAGEANARARRVGATLVAAECQAVQSRALRLMGRIHEATEAREAVIGQLQACGAATLLHEYEHDWQCAGIDG